MSDSRLIDRQTRLLRHLTSEAFIFGTEDLASAAVDPALQGMDLRRLRLEAEFSYNKRMKRLRQTFERTAALLGQRFSEVTRAFASTCPPKTYERYPDAERFFDHLRERWLQDSRTPPWVADVASIELALARARTLRPTTMGREALTTCPKGSRWYRTHPCTLLVRCGYDVWNLFEPRKSSLSAAHLQAGEAITQRDMHLAVAAVVGRRRPLVLEVTPEAFLLLERSTDWSRLGRNSASRDEGTDEETLVLQLAAQGLVLVSGEASRDGGRG